MLIISEKEKIVLSRQEKKQKKLAQKLQAKKDAKIVSEKIKTLSKFVKEVLGKGFCLSFYNQNFRYIKKKVSFLKSQKIACVFFDAEQISIDVLKDYLAQLTAFSLLIKEKFGDSDARITIFEEDQVPADTIGNYQYVKVAEDTKKNLEREALLIVDKINLRK